MTQLSFELGRKHGIRPRDVVCAITRDADVPAPSIGDIDVGKHRTLVQIAEPFVTKVLKRMRRGSMKGQPVEMVRVQPA
jgi:tryptophanase